MIELHFGNSINARFEEVINERAIEWDCSFDLAYTHSLKNLLNNVLLKKNKHGEDYFDLSFFIFLNELYNVYRSIKSKNTRIKSF